MTSRERMWALIQAVRYVENQGLPGAFVECGVWRGGSVMVMAQVLLDLRSTKRELLLYDTYAGMTEKNEIRLFTKLSQLQ